MGFRGNDAYQGGAAGIAPVATLEFSLPSRYIPGIGCTLVVNGRHCRAGLAVKSAQVAGQVVHSSWGKGCIVVGNCVDIGGILEGIAADIGVSRIITVAWC